MEDLRQHPHPGSSDTHLPPSPPRAFWPPPPEHRAAILRGGGKTGKRGIQGTATKEVHSLPAGRPPLPFCAASPADESLSHLPLSGHEQPSVLCKPHIPNQAIQHLGMVKNAGFSHACLEAW
ncbi:zinc finger protein RFP-like [Platysternon megacephalum]|uniref:Zinc finger protein RFP-like n=1 Tax=Platysternon megacephalum TaxID=55544 RepID=A0A4D9DM56_9SAUR|nr:zinc finger protein RFP-like [Platysternon megacephalum]